MAISMEQATVIQTRYDLLKGAERDQFMKMLPTMLDSEEIVDFDWESIVAMRDTIG